jgi:hypothetical protein
MVTAVAPGLPPTHDRRSPYDYAVALFTAADDATFHHINGEC